MKGWINWNNGKERWNEKKIFSCITINWVEFNDKENKMNKRMKKE